MPEWLRRLLTRRDNLLSLASVAVVVIVLILDIAGDVLPERAVEESLLVVLGLIAVSQIAERELRFNEVRDDLKRMEGEVARLSEPRFYKVSDLPSVLEFMRAGNELFYSGGHLHSLLHNHSNHFKQWLRDGHSLKFLLQDPDNEGLHYMEMPCVNYAPKVYVEQIRDSLSILQRLKAEIPNARLGVRVTGVSPTQSVAILNGHTGGTEMRILFHLPNGDSSSAPFSRLTRNQDGDWFQLFYDRFYKHLWRNSRIVVKHPDED